MQSSTRWVVRTFAAPDGSGALDGIAHLLRLNALDGSQQDVRRLALGYVRIYVLQLLWCQVHISGKHDDRHVWMRLSNSCRHFRAIHLGHLVIHDDRMNRFALQKLESGWTAFGEKDPVTNAFQQH